MPEPVFICGRQHSGNTVTALILGNAAECFCVNVEGMFFEHRRLIERLSDPRRRAERIVDILRLEQGELVEPLREWLVGWHEQHPDADAVEVYRQAMRHVTTQAGKQFWVRRATAYIFCAEEILELMPEARMIYLIRNPWDIAASRKRRRVIGDLMWSSTVSWNRGLAIADRLTEKHPDRVLPMKYEDLVTSPVESYQRLFDFVGVPFDEAYLDVPHVNRSEAYQTRTSVSRGLVASRVYYYPEVLTRGETAAVDLLVNRARVDELYPDRPHRGTPTGLGARIAALGHLAISPFRYLRWEIAETLRKGPAGRLGRLARRARAMTR